MRPADIPADEAARLAELRAYAILDTPAEQAFDDLTNLAAQICGAPIALMTLIDDTRQWFKSRVGVPLDETPRDLAFCAHAILDRSVMVVPDMHVDERFADSPFVTDDPRVRFYAGAPLVTPGGHALGTICVLDQVPRELRPDQLESLRALSRMAISLLEARQAMRQLAEASAEQQRAAAAHAQTLATLDATFQAIDDGILVIDGAGRVSSTNRRFGEIWRLTPEALATRDGDALLAASLPQLADPDPFRRQVRTLFRQPHSTSLDLLQFRDGRSVECYSVPLVIDGAPAGRIWGFRDATARIRAERERLEAQEQLIEAQAAALAELSTPLIPIASQVLAMPLIGSIDTQRAQKIVEAILRGTAEAQARTLIIDITGVPVVDTQVAAALVRAAEAVRLLGAHTTLCGIRPEVAQTLVSLGIDLSGLSTQSSLQRAIEATLALR